jgi:hypothetical protein
VKSLAVVVVALALAGCAKNIDNADAVKSGIIKDIGKKVDVQNMDVSVDSVSFSGKEATATVSFRPKGGDPAQSITMQYQMNREGDEWHVKGRNMARHEQTQPPAGGQTAPPITPGAPLPPGHPAMPASGGQNQVQIPIPVPITPQGSGAQSGQLPPGHPPLGSTK